MIFANSHWGKSQFLFQKSLGVEMHRRKVIADNIANADVPHFKRSQVSFESQLRRALQSEQQVRENQVPARATDERHIPFFRSMDYRSVQPRTHIDYLTTMRNDGNNVDVEEEMSNALKNQLRYQFISNQLNTQYKMMNIVMRPI